MTLNFSHSSDQCCSGTTWSVAHPKEIFPNKGLPEKQLDDWPLILWVFLALQEHIKILRVNGQIYSLARRENEPHKPTWLNGTTQCYSSILVKMSPFSLSSLYKGTLAHSLQWSIIQSWMDEKWLVAHMCIVKMRQQWSFSVTRRAAWHSKNC